MGDTQPPPETAKDFVISRVFDAVRERVWQALTDADCMRQWWGPTGFSVVATTMDLRPGGVFHCGMRSIEGYKMWGRFVYREIVPPQRLVFVNSFSNMAGDVTRNPIIPSWPLETLTTVLFDVEPERKTKVTVHWSAHNASEAERQTFDASPLKKVSWSGTFDQLAGYLAKA